MGSTCSMCGTITWRAAEGRHTQSRPRRQAGPRATCCPRRIQSRCKPCALEPQRTARTTNNKNAVKDPAVTLVLGRSRRPPPPTCDPWPLPALPPPPPLRPHLQQVRPGRVQHGADGPPQVLLCDHALAGHAEALGHGHEVGVDVLLVLGLVPLRLALAQVRVRAVGLRVGTAEGMQDGCEAAYAS